MPSAIPLQPIDRPVGDATAAVDTLLPEWGLTKRSIHRLCRRSRTVNTVVSAIEMRLGREEVLSLPQYMALCPTGQCNALCEFCSVTRNRTGIIKKQLPLEAIVRFTAPVARVIRMYGLEGNGEPTLYERFDELAAALLRNGSTAYLITNGDRLTPASIDALIAGGLDAVNFSLNAASPDTHRRVMKLKDFDRVLGNIRHVVRARGASTRPTVSISLVVTRENVHEVVDFIRLADELNVDRVLVRPLSEIATDLGAVEDMRALVPFESEIVDMLEGVQDYVRFTPRRAELEITPANFKAVRPDAPGTITAPPGYEDRLLPPRPAGWFRAAPDVSVDWSWNSVRVTRDGDSPIRLIDTAPIPVLPNIERRFECCVPTLTGQLTVSIGPQGGPPLASARARAGEKIVLTVQTGTNESLVISLETEGRVDARLDFDRLRTPAPVRGDAFLLPHSGRWEIASPDLQIEWAGSRVRVRGDVTAGPYLLKSYSIPTATGRHHSLNPEIEISTGVLGVGVLSADQQAWLTTRAVSAQAAGAVAIPFDSAENERVYVVLYGAAAGRLDATIDWGTAMEPVPERRAERHDSEMTAAAPARASVRRNGLRDGLNRLIHGRVRYYCQKPWTDLHNFTVDGRMDVCCIATGESQARYGLGNLMTQSFQQVWNGPRAREFRRTVNSGAPLPPCQRCPMAFAYQGPLFNPAGAERRVRRGLEAVCGVLPFGRRLYRFSDRVFPPLVSHVFFRGFKR